MEESCQMPSSRHDMVTTNVNSQQLRLLAQDQVSEHSNKDGGRATQATPLPGELQAVDGYGGMKRYFPLGQITTCRLPMLQWVTTTSTGNGQC